MKVSHIVATAVKGDVIPAASRGRHVSTCPLTTASYAHKFTPNEHLGTSPVNQR